jgi:hypothetical protein
MGLRTSGQDVVLLATVPTGLAFMNVGIAIVLSRGFSAAQVGMGTWGSSWSSLLLSRHEGRARGAIPSPFTCNEEVLVLGLSELDKFTDSQKLRVDETKVLAVTQGQEELVELLDQGHLEDPHELVDSIMRHFAHEFEKIIDPTNK